MCCDSLLIIQHETKDFTMNKVLFVLLSLYTLPHADLLAAEVAEATPKKQSTLDLSVEVLGTILTFIDNDVQKFSQTNKQNEGVALRIAASIYAKALKAGDHVPDDAMKVLHRAHVMRDKKEGVIHCIIQKIMDAGRSKRIHLPNAIPLFLRAFVTDKTSAVYDMINNLMIDNMPLNPHIKEHMKHSVGHYYESKEDKWATGFKQVMRDDLRAMAKQYRVLGAIEEDATLNGVQFIVIPDVGDTDGVITDRTKDLDTLFKKHPHLTLVVSFNDDVTRVGDDFCYDPLGRTSTLPASIKKLSFTGKNLQTIGDYFFYEASALASVDFRGLGALTTVGRGFFYDARSLTSVNLSGLRALTTVGHNFFYDARSLTSVDFRGLSALTTAGGCFFSYALSLTSVDLSGLGALTTIENYFFSDAHSLTSLDLRGLSALTTVGRHFFSHASALTRILCHNEKQAQLIRDQYVGGAACISVVQHPAATDTAAVPASGNASTVG